MERFEYYPQRTCSTKMVFEIEDDIVKDIEIIGGCAGNSLGIITLCKNQKVDDIIEKLDGIPCRTRGTSCPDQIAKALKQHKEKAKL